VRAVATVAARSVTGGSGSALAAAGGCSGRHQSLVGASLRSLLLPAAVRLRCQRRRRERCSAPAGTTSRRDSRCAAAAAAAAPAAAAAALDAPWQEVASAHGPPSEEALQPLRDMPPPAPSPPVLRGGGLLEVPTPGEMICKACGRMLRWKTRMEHLRGKDHWQALSEAHRAAVAFRTAGGRWAAGDDGASGAATFDLGGADYDIGTFAGMDGSWVDVVSGADGDDEAIVGPRWHMTELKAPSWPKRRGGNGICLDPTWTLDKVRRPLRLRIWRYLSTVMRPDRTLGDQSGPSVAELFAEADWSLVRVKELFESCETARIAARQLRAAERTRPVTHIYDLACGHGLVGTLLAYCFPDKQVLCIDRKRRSSFAAVVDRWLASERCARVAEAEGRTPLSNIEFVEADAYEELPARWAEGAAPEGALVVSVHACNEATPRAISLAEEHSMCWAVMPCCFDESLYLPLTPVRPRRRTGPGSHHGKAGLGDNARYLFVCGALAARHEAWLVREIDARITNRNLVLLGGSAWRAAATGPAKDRPPSSGRGAWNPLLAG